MRLQTMVVVMVLVRTAVSALEFVDHRAHQERSTCNPVWHLAKMPRLAAPSGAPSVGPVILQPERSVKTIRLGRPGSSADAGPGSRSGVGKLSFLWARSSLCIGVQLIAFGGNNPPFARGPRVRPHCLSQLRPIISSERPVCARRVGLRKPAASSGKRNILDLAGVVFGKKWFANRVCLSTRPDRLSRKGVLQQTCTFRAGTRTFPIMLPKNRSWNAPNPISKIPKLEGCASICT